MLRGIYKNNDGSISIIIPSQEVLAMFSTELEALHKVCDKDTPNGLPYWIVEDTDIPSDRSQRSAWTIDEVANPPHGYGAVLNTFEELV